jgi:hypothetical protein
LEASVNTCTSETNCVRIICDAHIVKSVGIIIIAIIILVHWYRIALVVQTIDICGAFQLVALTSNAIYNTQINTGANAVSAFITASQDVRIVTCTVIVLFNLLQALTVRTLLREDALRCWFTIDSSVNQAVVNPFAHSIFIAAFISVCEFDAIIAIFIFSGEFKVRTFPTETRHKLLAVFCLRLRTCDIILDAQVHAFAVSAFVANIMVSGRITIITVASFCFHLPFWAFAKRAHACSKTWYFYWTFYASTQHILPSNGFHRRNTRFLLVKVHFNKQREFWLHFARIQHNAVVQIFHLRPTVSNPKRVTFFQLNVKRSDEPTQFINRRTPLVCTKHDSKRQLFIFSLWVARTQAHKDVGSLGGWHFPEFNTPDK